MMDLIDQEEVEQNAVHKEEPSQKRSRVSKRSTSSDSAQSDSELETLLVKIEPPDEDYGEVADPLSVKVDPLGNKDKNKSWTAVADPGSPTSGGHIRGTGAVELKSTPWRPISPKKELEQSIFVAPLEQAAAWDFDAEYAAVNDPCDHMTQWWGEESPGYVQNLHLSSSTEVLEVISGVAGVVSVQADQSQPGPSGNGTSQTTEAMDVVPSMSGRTATSRKRAAKTESGSELDSDFDDEFDLDEIAASGGMTRNIPDNEELDEPISDIVNSVERAMDDAIDQLVGVSSDFTWSADFDWFYGVPETFSGPTPGPVEDYDTPYEAFTAIWSEDIILQIVRETNRYAKQVIEVKTEAGTLGQKSRLRRWINTDKNEIYLLFALYMFMGLDPRTSQHEFWKSTGYLEMPKFRQLMNYGRFILLNKFVHFQDNYDPSQDLPQSGGIALSAKLRKLAPVIGHLNDKFANLYNLHADIVIDESLTLFKGRLSWVQAIKSKAARVGIKSYELCESRTGYLHKFEIYTGKTHEHSEALANKSAQVVLELLKGLENRGHCVTMDNFYNSPALARYLKSQGFDCLGTLRPNRKNVPLEIKNVPKSVAKGTIVARHCGDVACIAWKDMRVVTMISTYHNAETSVGLTSGRAHVKPVVVRDYNNTMGGVDLKDQKLSMYLLERKRCVKWYMKMFKRLLNISVHNAFILLLGSLRRRNMRLITHRDFREQLANFLVAKHRLAREIVAPVAEIMRLRRDILHVPKKLLPKTRKRCLICHRNGIEKKVSLYCATCEEYMCFGDCWTVWHSSQKLPGRDVLVRKERRV